MASGGVQRFPPPAVFVVLVKIAVRILLEKKKQPSLKINQGLLHRYSPYWHILVFLEFFFPLNISWSEGGGWGGGGGSTNRYVRGFCHPA